LIDYFSQTLTTFSLDWNKIGAQGAEPLAYALRENKVTSFSSL